MKRILFILIVLVFLTAQAFARTGYYAGAGSAAAPAFTYYSAVFDGANDYLSKAEAITGLTDTKVGLISFWIKETTAFDSHIIMGATSGFLTLKRAATSYPDILAYDGGSTERLHLTSTAQVYNDGNWHHVLISWDLAQADKSWIYVDGADATTRTTHSDGALNLDVADWGIGAAADGSSKTAATLCEFYFTNEYLDISVQGNREKFRTSGGKPANLGANGSTPTGTQPLVYFHNAVTDWDNNLGSGGAFTENGAVADGGADIP